jgi:hypothetical protein
LLRGPNDYFGGAGADEGVVVGAGAVGVGAVAGAGFAGFGAAGAGAVAGVDAGAPAGSASRTEPRPALPLDDMSERTNDVSMKIPADQEVNRESRLAAPRGPNAL